MIGNSSFLLFKRNRQKETDKLSNILSCFFELKSRNASDLSVARFLHKSDFGKRKDPNLYEKDLKTI